MANVQCGTSASRPSTLVTGLIAILLASSSSGAQTEIFRLLPDDRQINAQFGRSVAISDDRAIVGANLEDFDGKTDAGAAYIFERNAAGDWFRARRLQASDAMAHDNFGFAVAIDGDRAIVGAYARASGGTAYIFERNAAGDWIQVTVPGLVAADLQTFDTFGISVAISGEHAIVGANNHNIAAPQGGAAYVHERDASGMWGPGIRLVPNGPQAPSDRFGRSVAIDGDRAIVGADLWGTNDFGAAFVFERQGIGAWSQTAELVRTDNPATWPDDRFGFAVAISGTRAVVGANQEDSIAPFAGAAYVFERDAGGTWPQVQKLDANPPNQNLSFGISVGILDNRLIVGEFTTAAHVFERDAAGTWGKADQLDTTAPATDFDGFGVSVSIDNDAAIVGAYREDTPEFDAGAAYVYELTSPTPQELITLLILDVQVMNIQSGITNSLDKKLESAQKALDDLNTNNDGAAINKINAFIDEVEAQRGSHLTEGQADQLRDSALEIILVIGS